MLVQVTWSDGESEPIAEGVTIEDVLRARFGKRHKCVAAKMDGVQVGLSTQIRHDVELEPIEADSDDGEHIIRHSCAHLLAQAVTELFPDAKPTIGPATEHGFYYDFDMEPISDEDLRRIEKRMKEIVRSNIPIAREEHSDTSLKNLFRHNQFKIEIINNRLEAGDGSTIYRQDDFYDLCLGPHVPRTSALQHFRLMSSSQAYWRADSTRERLVRIHGLAYASKERLKSRILLLEEAKKRDHRRLGRDLELFHIDEKVGQGLILWTPRGSILRQELQNFISYHLQRQGYKQVFTPHIGKLNLYRTSGHFPYYQDSQYPPLIERDLMAKLADEGCTCGELSNRMESGNIEGYLLKPMNCPHHVQLYSSKARSYRDLPLRLAEFGTVYRWEQSGEISGMTRVRGFTQDDAHLFVTEEQIAGELHGCIELVEHIFSTLGMTDYRVRVGLRDSDSSKYVGESDKWDKAENACVRAAEGLGVSFSREPGEAAFYGPKIDFVVRDVIGREWQLGTVQVDYNLPDRFDLTYIGKDGGKHRPVMIHRAPFGSLERFCGVLIEHFEGKFPTWLSPTQVHILTISEKHKKSARSLLEFLENKGFRVELDDTDATIGKKIRTHRAMRPAYILVLGDDEIENKTVSVRNRLGKQESGIPLDRFVELLEEEIKSKEINQTLVQSQE